MQVRSLCSVKQFVTPCPAAFAKSTTHLVNARCNTTEPLAGLSCRPWSCASVYLAHLTNASRIWCFKLFHHTQLGATTVEPSKIYNPKAPYTVLHCIASLARLAEVRSTSYLMACGVASHLLAACCAGLAIHFSPGIKAHFTVVQHLQHNSAA